MRSMATAALLLALSALWTPGQAQRPCKGLVGLDGSCTQDPLVDSTGRLSTFVATRHVSHLGTPVAMGAPAAAYERVTRGLTVQTVQPSVVGAAQPTQTGTAPATPTPTMPATPATPGTGTGVSAPTTPIRVCNGAMTCFRLRR